MNRTFTFYLLSNTHAPVRQLSVSRKFFWTVLFLVIASLTLAGAGLYDYIQVRNAYQNTLAISRQNTSQSQTIATQRSQLQNFAREIDALKSRLVELNTFEKKSGSSPTLKTPAITPACSAWAGRSRMIWTHASR